jgi:hypothetical protein
MGGRITYYSGGDDRLKYDNSPYIAEGRSIGLFNAIFHQRDTIEANSSCPTMWGPVGHQHRRRSDGDEIFWNTFYLVVYGGIVALCHYRELLISNTDTKKGKTNATTTQRSAQMMGLFHTVVCLHHVGWAFSRNWGEACN